MKLIAVLLFLFPVLASSVCAEDHEVIRLWPDSAPDEPQDIDQKRAEPEMGKDGVLRIPFVDTPELICYPVKSANASRTGVIVCPGGAYNKLAWNKEGTEIAEWLNSLGVQAFVLKYRVPRRSKVSPHVWPLQDLQRAIRIVRSNAKQWNVDPSRLGVMGFSAGGHLSAMSASLADKQTYKVIDNVDKIDARPDFVGLIYPAYLGDQKKDARNLDAKVNINEQTPPTFIAITHDDADRALFAALYYAELRRAGVAAELHIYSKGGHGYGLRPSNNAVSNWPKRMEDWLRAGTWIK